MIYTALAILYVCVCAVIGLRRGRSGSAAVLCASLATAMVFAQLALLLRG